MGRWVPEQKNRWNRWIDGWMDGWMDGWINGWMDGSMDGMNNIDRDRQMDDRQIDIYISVHSYGVF